MNGTHLDPNALPDSPKRRFGAAARILQRVLALPRRFGDPPHPEHPRQRRRSTMVGPLGGCFVIIVPTETPAQDD